MSAAPRFLIVKYIPDLDRMEPRNIGVLLWSENGVAARFIGEGQDKFRPPTFVEKKNRVAYADWIRFFRRNLAKEKLNGISSASPEFLDAIRSKARENYAAVEGGQLLASLASDECQEAADEIFERFVGDSGPSINLRQACERAIKSALTREQFERNYPFDCRVAGQVEHTFKFNYAGIPLGNLPRALFQRVDLNQEGSVNSATLMFESATKQKIRKDQCGALIVDGTSNHKSARSMLDLFATIVDVTNIDEARYTIRHMSGLNGEPK
jgi:hypothetical protein